MAALLRFDGVYAAPYMRDAFMGNADFYIRFFPDGTLRAAVSWDYSASDEVPQVPDREFLRLGDDQEDFFRGSYTLSGAQIRYRITDGPFVAEEGHGRLPDLILYPIGREPDRYTFFPYQDT